jgi:aminoglycoside phosphotransferase (APT) family kinase protein
VHWLPADPWLPTLSSSPDELARRLGIPWIGEEEVGLLAYKPRRRATLRLDGHVVKLYASGEDFRTAAAALLGGHRLAVPTATAAGVAADLRATAQVVVEGRSVDPASTAGDAGALLATLHRDPAGRVAAVHDPLRGAEASARLAAKLRPDLAGRIDALVTRLGQTRPADGTPVMLHGDFHAAQLLRADTELVLLDLDEVGAGPAALDLATYAAHLVRGESGDAESALAALDGLVAGYGARPRGLDWHFAAAILRRSPFPFRLDPGPDWPERVEAMVAAAEAALDGRP